MGRGIRAGSKIYFKDIKEFYKAAGREPTLFDKFVRETLSKNNLKKN